MASTEALGSLPSVKEKIVSYIEFNFKEDRPSQGSQRKSLSGLPGSGSAGGNSGGQTSFTPRENKLFDNL